MWLKYFLADLHISISNVVPVFCDNQAAIDIAMNPVNHARTKHIELDFHFIREKVQDKVILPTKIFTKFQLADIFTKALGGSTHWFICSKLGLHNPCVTPTCGGSNKANKDYLEKDVVTCTSIVKTGSRPQFKSSICHALLSQVNNCLAQCIWN